MNRLTEIYTAMHESNLDAIELLYNFAISLEKSIRGKLESEISELKGQVYAGNHKPPLTEQDIDRIFSRIWEELHEEGYFLAAKWATPRNPKRGKLGEPET